MKNILSEEFKRMQKLAGIKQPISENYDLVSQFKGDHHGNPMEPNKYLTSLGLDENGIETLQTWLNLMKSDETWFNKKYPKGAIMADLIQDIIKQVKDLPSFVAKNKSLNPIKVANWFKRLKSTERYDEPKTPLSENQGPNYYWLLTDKLIGKLENFGITRINIVDGKIEIESKEEVPSFYISEIAKELDVKGYEEDENEEIFPISPPKKRIKEDRENLKLYGIERDYSPYDFGPYTHDEAKQKSKELNIDSSQYHSPRLYNDMRAELPASQRMHMPYVDQDGDLYYPDSTPFSQGDLADY